MLSVILACFRISWEALWLSVHRYWGKRGGNISDTPKRILICPSGHSSNYFLHAEVEAFVIAQLFSFSFFQHLGAKLPNFPDIVLPHKW